MLNEGRIHAVEIDGLDKTRRVVVLREFPLKQGNIFNSIQARKGIDNIYSTGLFEKVSLNLVSQRGRNAIVKIKVKEKASTVLRLGGHFESERGSRGFIEVGNENVLGIGSQLLGHGNIGSRDREVNVSWKSDRFLHTFLTFSTGIYYSSNENFVYRRGDLVPTGEYREDRLGIRLLFGQNVRRFGVVSVGLRSERSTLSKISGDGYPVGSNSFNSLKISSVVDTRDRVPFSRNGRFVKLFYQYFKPYGENTTASFKLFSHLESFQSLGPHTLRAKFVGGTSDRTILFSERFRISGPIDVYGLRNQEQIGSHMLIGSLQYRYQLRKRSLLDTYLSLRYDLSGIWDDPRDVSQRRLRHSLGLAVDLDSPIGPVGIAVGFFELKRRRIYFRFSRSF